MPTQDALKPALLSMIDECVGERSARTADAFAERLGLEGKYRDRTVRLMIEDLIWTDGLAVVAGGTGFYKPETWAEWLVYKDQMDSRIKNDVMRRDQVEKNVYNLFHGQKTVRML
jgi:hypothetical protein